MTAELAICACGPAGACSRRFVRAVQREVPRRYGRSAAAAAAAENGGDSFAGVPGRALHGVRA